MKASIKDCAGMAGAILASLAVPGVAYAQRAAENAVTSADDAFGTNVGQETTGIYSEYDTRGFSPLKAGNVRIDGIYFDQSSMLSGRLRESTSIRVGFSAQDYPFHAPTGIVDHKFRAFPDKFGNSLSYSLLAYGGTVAEWDLRLPVVKDHISLTGGLAYADLRQTDGSGNLSFGFTVRPIFRFSGVEISPFIARGEFKPLFAHPLVVVTGSTLPNLPQKRRYFGQSWAGGDTKIGTTGITIKAPLTGNLSLRAGMFRSGGSRITNYSEIFSIIAPSGLADHLFISDPKLNIHSTSGEAQIALRLGSGRWQHRFIAGYRARNRLTESGGSDVRNFGQVIFGELDPEPEPNFTYSAVNIGRVRQSSLMLGYTGKLAGAGSINLGIQKARYHATYKDGRTDVIMSSRDNAWLYNATLGIDITPSLSVYLGTERGLEDSGVAPENAVNRSEQLPATRSTQYEGGVRWKFHGGQLAVNAFQISKPYFTFDAAKVYTEVGTVRHRGVEASLSGHLGQRLSLLAGAVMMQPRVTGLARDLGLVGERPAGTSSLYVRIDANYRTNIFGGLTPTASFTYTGDRAVGSRPLAALDGRQLMVPGYAAFDLGLRQQFKIGTIPASFRAVLADVFDAATWKVLAANTLTIEERRRFTLSLAADF